MREQFFFSEKSIGNLFRLTYIPSGYLGKIDKRGLLLQVKLSAPRDIRGKLSAPHG